MFSWRRLICENNSAKLICERNAERIRGHIGFDVLNQKIAGIFAVKSRLNVVMADEKHSIDQNFSWRFIDHLNDWIFVFINDFKDVCFWVAGIIPIPKAWRLRQTIRENGIHFIAHHNPLIICERYFYEHIKPVADNLRKHRVIIFDFPVYAI